MMNIPNPGESLHKAMLYRLLISLLDEKALATQLYFKGGTAAAMLGWLDRFSIDLDFDGASALNKKSARPVLRALFASAGFTIKDQAKQELYFVLQYPAPPNLRNTLKVSIIENRVKANVYRPYYLADISRYSVCQSLETMVANKLIAVTERYAKYRTIAGRDLYDIHYFFAHGYGYNEAVIVERTGLSPARYLKKLTAFIQHEVTEKIISEDLNALLPPGIFQSIRKTLKAEVLLYLREEQKRA